MNNLLYEIQNVKYTYLMTMPKCAKHGDRIKGVAYTNKKLNGYLCEKARDEEEQELDPIEERRMSKVEKERIQKQFWK